jgi:membrane protease YdiL (CAAX protease family)
MGEETLEIELAGAGSLPAAPPGAPTAQPNALLFLVLSLPLIAAGATLICALLAAAGVGIVYLHVGSDGFADFYSDLRYDPPLRTEVGAALVGGFYIGTAVTTFLSARVSSRGSWIERLAVAPGRGRRGPALAVAVAALSYAAIATLVMTLSQANRIVTSGATDVLLLATFVTNLVVLAPIAEELFFRGWLYTGLRRRLSFWPSYLLTALFFAAIHYDANHRRFFLVLPLALALGILREVSGSIRPTIALHAAYNLVIVAITLFET